jgi:hypothetical protein
MGRIRTHPIDGELDAAHLPQALFDPRWRDPSLAAETALRMFRLGEFGDVGSNWTELASETPAWPKKSTAVVDLSVGTALPIPDLSIAFKGGAINELHHRYAYGAQRQTANFHAKIVCAGLDSEGRFFLRALVGRYGGFYGDEAGLSAAFWSGSTHLGSAIWQGSLDSKQDLRLVLRGRSSALSESFGAVDSIRVAWYAREVEPERRRRTRARGTKKRMGA